MKIEENSRLEFYKKMLLIRLFEYKIVEFARSGKIYGSVHLCVGEEASAVGSGSALRKEDYVLPTHRGHGQAIAKGTNVNKLLAEISAKETGICKGRAGSMHFFDRENNIVGSQGVLGAQFPIAIGLGLAINLKKEKGIAVCYFGDGTSNQGLFYEGMNFADLWSLPILYICTNNLYGMGTHYSRTSKVDIFEKAGLFKIKTDTADGNDVEEVYEKTLNLAEYVRNERKPALIELYTYRWLGHSALDSRPYRPKEEVEEWIKKDPIKRYEEKLLKEGILKNKIQEIKDLVEKQITEAAKFAEDSPFPEFTNDIEI
jgi:acetoin:2,6-dichlorophenolindophenol oxidoreductase subunit alpha